ncbi:transposase [Lactobacillus sp. W8093]|nr:transposase [Lactobacillus sp. W8093]
MRIRFPNAEIVIDRFHIVQMHTRSFNSLRVQGMKKLKKDQQRI